MGIFDLKQSLGYGTADYTQNGLLNTPADPFTISSAGVAKRQAVMDPNKVYDQPTAGQIALNDLVNGNAQQGANGLLNSIGASNTNVNDFTKTLTSALGGTDKYSASQITGLANDAFKQATPNTLSVANPTAGATTTNTPTQVGVQQFTGAGNGAVTVGGTPTGTGGATAGTGTPTGTTGGTTAPGQTRVFANSEAEADSIYAANQGGNDLFYVNGVLYDPTKKKVTNTGTGTGTSTGDVTKVADTTVDNTLKNGASDATTTAGRAIDAPVGTVYKPDLNSKVDEATETIQGRMQGLLATDASGKFTTPAVQQAANAARALFARRGLLNSSMAQEAVMEAAISKAIEIAGPDADKYFQNRRGNVDWTNKYGQQYLEQSYGLQNKAVTQDYTLERDAVQQGYTQDNMRLGNTLQKDILGVQHGYAKDLATLQHGFNTADMTLQDSFNRGMATLQNTLAQGNFDKETSVALQANYMTSLNKIESQRTAEIAAIQSADMEPEDKNAAIASINLKYANSANIMTSMFEKMPGWVKTWATTFDETDLASTAKTENDKAIAAAKEREAAAAAKTGTTGTFDQATLDKLNSLDPNGEPTDQDRQWATEAIAAGYRFDSATGKWVK